MDYDKKLQKLKIETFLFQNDNFDSDCLLLSLEQLLEKYYKTSVLEIMESRAIQSKDFFDYLKKNLHILGDKHE